MLIAGQLDEQKQALLDIQKTLLKNGGLTWLDDVDEAIRKLQILVDRVKTASYGYAGLFDAVRIQEEQLDALHKFDTGLACRVVAVEAAVKAVAAAVTSKENIQTSIDQVTSIIAELNTLFGKRNEAILDPALLNDATFVPGTDLPADAPPQ